MNKNVLIGVVAVLVIILGIFFFMSQQSDTDVSTVSEVTEDTESLEMEDSGDPSHDMIAATPTGTGVSSPLPSPSGSPATSPSAANPSVKSFTVTGANFQFSPAEMRVQQGDTVRVTFVNSAGVHDWKLDEFNAATQVLQAGQQETVEFVADQAGEFEYYCSVGNHRQMGMVGKLIVE